MSLRHRLLLATTLCCAAYPATAQVPAPPPAAPAPPTPSAPPAPPARAGWYDKYQDARSGPETVEPFARAFKVGPSGSLDLFNLSGEVVVTGIAGDEIRVDARKLVRAKSAGDAKQQLEAVKIEATETGGRVEVRTFVPRSRGKDGKDFRVEVVYDVQVPVGAAVSLRTMSGNLRVTNVKGDVRLETVSGNIETTKTAKLSRVKTVSGDIHITSGASIEGLTGGTISGTLTLRGMKARSLDLSTVSGDLVLIDTMCERAMVRTINGDLEFSGPLVKAGRYEFSTHNGDIRLKLAATSGFELLAKTFNGDLRTEMPINITSTPDDPDLPAGVPQKHELRGTFGDGSALLVVRTFSGSVVVGRRDDGAKPPAEKEKGKPKP
jgi:DUF4097 and DUF4098 domain-containing protein YvlB